MIDLTTAQRRFGLRREPTGDALRLPCGQRLVAWGSDRLAVTGGDPQLVRYLAREIGGASIEFTGHCGGTVSFDERRLGRVIHVLESIEARG